MTENIFVTPPDLSNVPEIETPESSESPSEAFRAKELAEFKARLVDVPAEHLGLLKFVASASDSDHRRAMLELVEAEIASRN